MTLAVAGICPWGAWPVWYRSMGLSAIEHVILATDSRWSERRGSRTRPLLDVGKKLYRIGTHAAVVYAGDILSAHDGIKRLRRVHRRARDPGEAEMLKMASASFQLCHAKHMRTRIATEPLHVLLALGLPRVGVRLYYMGYETNFRAERRNVVTALGEEMAKEAFFRSLGEGIGVWWEERKPLDRVTDWAIAISGSLDAAAQSPASKTVGGKVQLGILSQDGFTDLKLIRLDYVAPKGERDEWGTVTSEGTLEERPPDPH